MGYKTILTVITQAGQTAQLEAAVALAIVINFYNNHMTVDVDSAEELHG